MNLRKVLKPAVGILALALTAVLSSCIFIWSSYLEVGTFTFYNNSSYTVTITNIRCDDSRVYPSAYSFTLSPNGGQRTITLRAPSTYSVYSLGIRYEYSPSDNLTLETRNGTAYFTNKQNSSILPPAANIIADPSATEEESSTASATATVSAQATATAAPVNQ